MQPDDAAELPPISVEPTSAPFDLPTTHKPCPDCARGVEAPGIAYPRDPLRPIEEFFAQRAARYKGEQRYSAYCKPHQRKRNNDYRAGKRAGLPEEEKRKVADAVAESVKRSGYEQSPQRIAARRANFRAWHARNRDYDLERNATWVEQHAERRRLISRQSKQRRARGEWAVRSGPRTPRAVRRETETQE